MKMNRTNNDSFFDRYFHQAKWKTRTVKKNELIQEAGRVSSKMYYVKSGLLRSYTIDDNGKVHIYTFVPEGWVVSDLESDLFHKPSDLYIDAIEDTVIVEINELTTSWLTQLDEKDKAEIIHVLYKRVAVLQRRVLLLMSATAMQRYEHFIDTYPQLINRVPLKMIASYLGITPEALSNIRSKMRST